MIKRTIDSFTTAEEARDYAIAWQHWSSTQAMSYGELAAWQDLFEDLAVRFGLQAEFHENGII